MRRVELEVDVGEDEHAAGGGGLLHFGSNLREALIVAGRADDELHRRAAGGAGQRRRREGEDRAAGDGRELGLQFVLHDLLLRPLSLVPWLQQNAGEGLVHAGKTVDDEEMRLLGNGLDDLPEFLRRRFRVIEIAGLRGLDQRQQNALVLLGRELLRRRDEHDGGNGEHADEDRHRQRAEVERPVQAALVAAAQRVEAPVEPGRETAALARRMGLQQFRAHHRRKRERDDARDDDGAGQREGEFAEQRAGEP